MLSDDKEKALFAADLATFYPSPNSISAEVQGYMFEGWLLRKRSALARVLGVVVQPSTPKPDAARKDASPTFELSTPMPEALAGTDAQELVLEISEYRDTSDLPLEYLSGSGHLGDYRISTRKLKAWLPGNEHEFRYIRRVVEACISGQPVLNGTVKYSYGDSPEFFSGLEPDKDCKDPVRSIRHYVRGG